jgi:hypothetical protein
LNIQNGNNNNLAGFGVTGNPNLLCIQVDNPTFMNSTWSAGKDATATFALNCPLIPASALNIDNVDDNISTPYFARPNNLTIQVWVKKDNDTEAHILNWYNSGAPQFVYTDLFIQQTSRKMTDRMYNL